MWSLPGCGVRLVAITVVCASVSAAQTATGGALAKARVQHVEVRGSADALEVEIQTSGAPVAPDTQVITGPDRIVVDFPGALPAQALHALTVNRGVLKAVRSGLFFDNPPITRIVLDLSQPQSYRISTSANGVVVKLSPAKAGESETTPFESHAVAPKSAPKSAPKLAPVRRSAAETPVTAVAGLPANPAASLQNVALADAAVGGPIAGNAPRTAPLTAMVLPAVASEAAPAPPAPVVNVIFANALLRIRAEHTTLAQVLFEVQRQTQAEIAIPAGAEQEPVIVDLGPGPARDVLAALFNGSPYNFIFVGSEQTLERVILTRRDPNPF